MKVFGTQFKNKRTLLALGPESDGNFSYFKDGKVYFADGFGDLLDDGNFKKFQRAVLDFVGKNGKPDVVISDLHPLFRTTDWGKDLAEKFGAEFVQVQHHLAHIMSAVGDNLITQQCRPKNSADFSGKNPKHEILNTKQIQNNKSLNVSNLEIVSDFDIRISDLSSKSFYGIACDGTGYGLDERVWGGEVFRISNFQFPISNHGGKVKIERVGKLENQTLIGGELAIKEPARMLIGILGKFLGKDEVYKYVKDFYSKNEFELLWNQWKEGFNCLETSSTGRILDAVSVLLGFSPNERAYKHAPIDLLEKNSTKPYEIEPIISERKEKLSKNVILATSRRPESEAQMTQIERTSELQTTPLFEYLVKNLGKDKKRLAATAQLYLAKGLWEVVSSLQTTDAGRPVFFAGGIANNKIISNYLVSKGVIISQKFPRGDAGISFGQLMYYLLSS